MTTNLFLTPKNSERQKPFTGLYNIDECVVRRAVHKFYITEKNCYKFTKRKTNIKGNIHRI